MADTDIQMVEAENASWKQTGKDLGSGAAGGIAQVLLGEFNLQPPRWNSPSLKG